MIKQIKSQYATYELDELIDVISDENSDFHKNNPVSLKKAIIEACIDDYLRRGV
jgi:hypothetical protein